MQSSSNAWPNCFICDGLVTAKGKDILNCVSKTTKTPISLFLEQFHSESLARATKESMCCSKCLDQINDYDVALHAAQQVEKKLIELLSATNEKYTGHSLAGSTETHIKIENIKQEQDDFEETGTKELAADTEPNPCTTVVKEEYCFSSDDDQFDNLLQPTDPNSTIPHYCSSCCVNFETADLLQKHILFTHNLCTLCGKKSKSQFVLRFHNCKAEWFKCDICDRKYNSKSSLKRHTDIHTRNYRYECKTCGKPFIHFSSYTTHVASHTNARPHKCEICGNTFTTIWSLRRHTKRHTGEKPYHCGKCNKAFSERFKMALHFRTRCKGTSTEQMDETKELSVSDTQNFNDEVLLPLV